MMYKVSDIMAARAELTHKPHENEWIKGFGEAASSGAERREMNKTKKESHQFDILFSLYT